MKKETDSGKNDLINNVKKTMISSGIYLNLERVLAGEGISDNHGFSREELGLAENNIGLLLGNIRKEQEELDFADQIETITFNKLNKIVDKIKNFSKFKHKIIINKNLVGITAIISALTPETKNEENSWTRFIYGNVDDIIKDIGHINPDELLIIVNGEDAETDVVTKLTLEELEDIFQKHRNLQINNHIFFDTTKNLEDTTSLFSDTNLFCLGLADVDVRDFISGAKEVIEDFFSAHSLNNLPCLMAVILNTLIKKGQYNLVFMPFSKKMRLISDFAMETFNTAAKEVGIPMVALRAEGPASLHTIMQAVLKAENHFLLITFNLKAFSNDFKVPEGAGVPYYGHYLGNLMRQSQIGAVEAMKLGDRPSVDIEIEKLNAKNIGAIVAFIQLTATMLKQLNSVDVSERGMKEDYQKLLERELVGKGVSVKEEPILSFGTGNLDLEAYLGDEVDDGTFNLLLADLLKKKREIIADFINSKTHYFWSLPERIHCQIETIKALAEKFKSMEEIWISSAGGSKIGWQAELDLLAPLLKDKPKIRHFDTYDPCYIRELIGRDSVRQKIQEGKIGVALFSLSGETSEINVNGAILLDKMKENRPRDYAKFIIAVTNEHFGVLREVAEKEGFWFGPLYMEDGGRFGAGIAFNDLFVLALKGLDIDLIVEEAEKYSQSSRALPRDEVLEKIIGGLYSSKPEEWMKARDESLKFLPPSFVMAGVSHYLTTKRQKNLTEIIAYGNELNADGPNMYLAQLFNETIGQPGIDHWTVIVNGDYIDPIQPGWLNGNGDRTIFNLIFSAGNEGALENLSRAKYEVLKKLLIKNRQPLLALKVPEWNYTTATALLMHIKENAMLEVLLKGEKFNPYQQAGVVSMKRITRQRLAKGGKQLEDKRFEAGKVFEVGPSLAHFLEDSFVTSLHPLSEAVKYVESCELENRMRNILLERLKANPDVREICFRGDEVIQNNSGGNFRIVAVPIDDPSIIERMNGTTGTVLGVYSSTSNELLATLLVSYGPVTTVLLEVKELSGRRSVHDFLVNEDGRLVGRMMKDREDSRLLLTKPFGERVAVGGSQKSYPEAFSKYMEFRKKTNMSYRYTGPVSNLLEILYNSGLWADWMTMEEAKLYARIIETVGGRSLVMTEKGPKSILEIETQRDSFDQNNLVFAYFGNSENIAVLKNSIFVDKALIIKLENNLKILLKREDIQLLPEKIKKEYLLLILKLKDYAKQFYQYALEAQNEEWIEEAVHLSANLMEDFQILNRDQSLLLLGKEVEKISYISDEEIVEEGFILLGNEDNLANSKAHMISPKLITKIKKLYDNLSLPEVINTLEESYPLETELRDVISQLHAFYQSNMGNIGFSFKNVSLPASSAPYSGMELEAFQKKIGVPDEIIEVTDILVNRELVGMNGVPNKGIISSIKKGFYSLTAYEAYGETNITEDELTELDKVAGKLINTVFERESKIIYGIYSEDQDKDIEDLLVINEKGKIILATDPLCGSSRIDVNGTVATRVGIALLEESESKTLIGKPASRLDAVIEIVYGKKTILLFSMKNKGSYLFYEDEKGNFIYQKKLSIPYKKMEKDMPIAIAIGGIRNHYADTGVKEYLEYLERRFEVLPGYTGSLGADNYQISNVIFNKENELITPASGIYVYPVVGKRPKIRTVSEINSLALQAKETGLYASNGYSSSLDDIFQGAMQESPIFLGRWDLVKGAELNNLWSKEGIKKETRFKRLDQFFDGYFGIQEKDLSEEEIRMEVLNDCHNNAVYEEKINKEVETHAKFSHFD